MLILIETMLIFIETMLIFKMHTRGRVIFICYKVIVREMTKPNPTIHQFGNLENLTECEDRRQISANQYIFE